MADVHLYDEHKDVRGVARERVTVDTRISSSNRGFAMLAKMGWTEGKPVGVSSDGTSVPDFGISHLTQSFTMHLQQAELTLFHSRLSMISLV